MYTGIMETELRLDRLGRVVIPKAMRDELGIRPGDRLRAVSGSGRLELEVALEANPMKKEHGIWVYYPESVEPSAAGDMITEIREERIRKLAR